MCQTVTSTDKNVLVIQDSMKSTADAQMSQQPQFLQLPNQHLLQQLDHPYQCHLQLPPQLLSLLKEDRAQEMVQVHSTVLQVLQLLQVLQALQALHPLPQLPLQLITIQQSVTANQINTGTVFHVHATQASPMWVETVFLKHKLLLPQHQMPKQLLQLSMASHTQLLLYQALQFQLLA